MKNTLKDFIRENIKHTNNPIQMINQTMLSLEFAICIFGILLFTSCGFDSVEKAGIKYATKPAFELPANIQWQQVGTAKELINVKENLAVISDGDNAIPKEAWDDFKVRLPWQKNIDRNILFDKTAFLRSPKNLLQISI